MTATVNIFNKVCDEIRKEKEALENEKFQELITHWNESAPEGVLIQNLETWFDAAVEESFRAEYKKTPCLPILEGFQFCVTIPVEFRGGGYGRLQEWVFPKLRVLMNQRLVELGFLGFRVKDHLNRLTSRNPWDIAIAEVLVPIMYDEAMGRIDERLEMRKAIIGAEE